MKFVGVLGAVVLLAAGCEAPQDHVVGTSGTLPDDEPEGIIHEVETITGMNDGHELVGRRVDLHGPVQGYVNDRAFWVGSADNRVLVVLPSAHGLDAESDGETVAIWGTVDRVPKDQIPYSWGRPIYIRADTVSPTLSAGTP